MNAKDRISLFCANCGKRIDRLDVCPSCQAPNEFLDVTPPRSVRERREEQPQVSTTAASDRKPPAAEGPRTRAHVTPREPLVTVPPTAPTDPTYPTVPFAERDDRTVPLGARDEPEVMAVLLRQKPDSNQESLRFELHEGESTIGRKDSDLLIPSRHVSKLHAAMRIERHGVHGRLASVIDLGSENGTQVNGHMLKPNDPLLLRDRDVVAFADVEFLYRVQGTGS